GGVLIVTGKKLAIGFGYAGRAFEKTFTAGIVASPGDQRPHGGFGFLTGRAGWLLAGTRHDDKRLDWGIHSLRLLVASAEVIVTLQDHSILRQSRRDGSWQEHFPCHSSGELLYRSRTGPEQETELPLPWS